MKTYLFLFATLVLSQAAYGQEPSKDSVRLVSSSQLKGKEVDSRISKYRKSKEVRLLIDYLNKKGFKALTGNVNYFGMESVRETIADKKRITTYLYIQDFGNGKTKESAAIGITGCNDGESKPYYFVLIIPDGQFDSGTEYFTENGNVVQAKSWKSCIKNNIGGCAATCVTAAVTCSGTAAAYLGCLGLACGSCLAWELACCSCDCGRFCKYAVGCCRR